MQLNLFFDIDDTIASSPARHTRETHNAPSANTSASTLSSAKSNTASSNCLPKTPATSTP